MSRASEVEAVVLVLEPRPARNRDLRRLLRANGLEPAAYATPRELLADLPLGRLACVLSDVRLPGMCGFELLERLLSARPPLPLVFLTSRGTSAMGLRALRAGAVDFLVRPVAEMTVVDAVQEALRRAECGYERWARADEVQRTIAGLTTREREVLDLVAGGLLNKQIARHIGASEKTVKIHRARVMQKTGARSLAELVRLVEQGDLRSSTGVR